MSRKRVLIISAGIFPIPADSGGAVEELIDSFAEKAVADVDALTIASCAYHGKRIKSPVEGVSYQYIDFPFYVKLLQIR